MFRPRIIPCLLLKDRGLVKTVKFKDPRYIGDPINAVKIFNDFEADELVFLDIDASKNNKTIDLDFVKKVGQEAFVPFAVGGGIKSTDQIKALLNAGSEKVVINSSAIENSQLIKEASEIFGSQSIIASIDVKKENGKYSVYGCGGTKKMELDLIDFAKKVEKLGAGEIMINSIDLDGTMEGFDIELIKSITDNVKIPVIAVGGAGSLEDMKRAVEEGGASAVSAGSIFVYSGKSKGILINYPDKEDIEEIFSHR